jgi:hypothetical protein
VWLEGWLLAKPDSKHRNMGEREGRKAIVAVLADKGRVGEGGANSNDSKKTGLPVH